MAVDIISTVGDCDRVRMSATEFTGRGVGRPGGEGCALGERRIYDAEQTASRNSNE